MSEDQSYYWTDEWQANEAAAVEEIRNGEALIFDNAYDAVEWLSDGTLHVEPLPEHREDAAHPWRCRCGLQGMYELGAWVCPRSVAREPVPPVSLTRGGFMLSR